MVKKYSILAAAFLMLFSFRTEKVNAQLSGPNAYIKGTGIEIGISGPGGFEGSTVDTVTAPVPAGMHFRSNTTNFGFVANPQANAWATFDGDFFTPGSPENGWGFEIGMSGGPGGSNNCASPNNIVASTPITYSHVGTVYSVDWEGDATSGTDLHFKINYLLNETDLFYSTSVWITNNTPDTIPDLYYYRNLDPDNNVVLSGDYVTTNTIISQPVSGGTSVASVSATQALPWLSYFSFTAVDTNFKAGIGGFSNRDASDMYYGTGFSQGVGYVNTADKAIYMACRIQNLEPGGTRMLRCASTFDSAAAACAGNALRVTLPAYADVSSGSPAFALTGGFPAGGTFLATPGVSGNMFDPSVTGTGTFDVIYSYTDSTGCTGNAISQVHVADVTTGVAASTVVNAHVSVYPNPFSDETTISVGNSIQLANASVHIFDVLGKEVKVITGIHSNEIKIDRKGLPGGMYFYKLVSNNKQIASGKIVIR